MTRTMATNYDCVVGELPVSHGNRLMYVANMEDKVITLMIREPKHIPTGPQLAQLMIMTMRTGCIGFRLCAEVDPERPTLPYNSEAEIEHVNALVRAGARR